MGANDKSRASIWLRHIAVDILVGVNKITFQEYQARGPSTTGKHTGVFILGALHRLGLTYAMIRSLDRENTTFSDDNLMVND